MMSFFSFLNLSLNLNLFNIIIFDFKFHIIMNLLYRCIFYNLKRSS